MLLARLLQQAIRVGTLAVVDAGGATHLFQGRVEGPSITVRLHDERLHRRLFYNPALHVGEAYMAGTLTVEDGTIYDFLDLVGRNYEVTRGAFHPFTDGVRRLDELFRRAQQYNTKGRARGNVAHHYDLSSALYDLFLDRDRQYSCAYFPNGDEDLETAQALKKRHIAAKLLVEPGHRVLDIGSGWGGMGLYLAREYGARVVGVTLSEEQLKLSRARAERAGLAGRAGFDLKDYREVEGRFDRVVSVGMFEHVGLGHYRTYFRKVRQLLADDGVALVHTIGSSYPPPYATNPWIRKYIFPGGYTPALSEILTAVEKEGLWVTDVEVLRLHYAQTLRHWRRRFTANRDRAKALYDETFCRMWEFYLAASEVSFRHMGNVVFQLQLARRQDAVPLTRDYIVECERSPEPRRVSVA
ncbi:MAG: class I SAM-dependent methyltransferase [Geminicoccaceae bacterium]|nr:class I SAM-dependent methyltransferase [Geminicoccaceae bacterium]